MTPAASFSTWRARWERRAVPAQFAAYKRAGLRPAYLGEPNWHDDRAAAARRLGLVPAATVEEIVYASETGDLIGCPCQHPVRAVGAGGGPWLPSRRADLCVARLVEVGDIDTDPARFQNRTDAFSELSAQAVADHYDPNKFDPIVIWRDPARGRWFVLSGHSRLEGMRRRFASHIPAREFEGTEAEAIQFARIDANRGGTAESLIEDLAAYRLMRDGDEARELKPAKKSELSQAFKGKAAKLEAWAQLNPGGLFVQTLSQDNRSEYPHLEARATWVGNFRKQYGADFTNTYEDDCFRFFYSDARNLKLSHKDFTQEIDKRLAWGRARLFPECDGQECRDLEELSKRGPQAAAYKELERLQSVKATIQERLRTTDRGGRVYTDQERARLLDIGKEVDAELKKLRASLKVAEEAPMLFGVGAASARPTFTWEFGNLKHVVCDHQDRKLGADEIESLWDDPHRFHADARPGPDGIRRKSCIGRTSVGRFLIVFYLESNAWGAGMKVRVFSGRPLGTREIQKHEAYRETIGG